MFVPDVCNPVKREGEKMDEADRMEISQEESVTDEESSDAPIGKSKRKRIRSKLLDAKISDNTSADDSSSDSDSSVNRNEGNNGYPPLFVAMSR